MITDDVAAAVLDSLPSRIAVLGPDGTVVRLNDAWRRSAAAGLAVVPVRPGASWLAACEAAGKSAAPLRTLAALTRRMLNSRRDQVHVEIPVATPRGERWVDVRIRALSRGDGLVVVVDDITDRHGQEAGLRHRATHDSVTGLPNRVALRDLINNALGPRKATRPGQATPSERSIPTGPGTSSERGGASGGSASPSPTCATSARQPAGSPTTAPEAVDLAVLFLDLDGFRLVNHRFGYPVGDGALRAVAQRFREALGSDALLGHWGGDEFVVVATGTTRPAVAALAERLGSALSEPLPVSDHQIRLTVSVGQAFAEGVRSGHEGATPAATRDPDDTTGSSRPRPPMPDAETLVKAASEEIVRARATREAFSARQPGPESGTCS
ncbi:sensor domain-containing diguanylate cyclase [Frankia sp. EI5c]|uniref:sensor domain-containing diguanylate cyclase n=1 Tax=Frankia sp. EI5c TaxID=683316 RepID=UPI0008265720|nr:sensor domain-containing diguanylate cyclase [Frankia sp. EI5c]